MIAPPAPIVTLLSSQPVFFTLAVPSGIIRQRKRSREGKSALNAAKLRQQMEVSHSDAEVFAIGKDLQALLRFFDVYALTYSKSETPRSSVVTSRPKLFVVNVCTIQTGTQTLRHGGCFLVCKYNAGTLLRRTFLKPQITSDLTWLPLMKQKARRPTYVK